MKVNGKNPFDDLCFLISEIPGRIPLKGDCFDALQWQDVSKSDVEFLKGMQDHLSGKASTGALNWKSLASSQPKQAQRVLSNYSEAVHGSRSYTVLNLASQGKARILPVRNITSISPQAEHLKDPKAVVTTIHAKYSKDCTLIKYSSAEVKEFQKNNHLLGYQERLSQLLSENKSIRLVNLSIGYKKSWIQEENPQCPIRAWETEYEILRASWKNLLQKHPSVLFVVAAGNEVENFDDYRKASNDLWPTLMPQENLLIVGSMSRSGTRYKSSNFGRTIEVMALGENIPASSPLPGDLNGYKTEIRGTSFSAPVVTGQAVQYLKKNPKMSLGKLKSKLVEKFLKSRKTILFENYKENCGIPKKANECLDILASFLQTPGLLWDETADIFLLGKTAWDFEPFPMAFDPSVKVSGQIKMLPVGEKLLPGLILNPNISSEELLLTLHHEIYHFASMKEAFKDFFVKEKVGGCLTPYQLALLKDETPAYEREYQFYEKAPKWFRDSLKKIQVESQLFQLKMSLAQFYDMLSQKLKIEKNFIARRYIELGQYPACASQL